MAFVRTNLLLWARAGVTQKKLYLYDAGADTMATVKAANYFDAAQEPNERPFAVGDLVYVIANDGQFFTRCSGASGSAVTVVNLPGQAVLTDSSTGSAGATVADVTASHNQTILNDNFASITAALNKVLQAIGS